ncbi:coiled-coil domain-containing protein 112-like isoform X1 [Octopus sinensis]|uniref:Coiled-coil domain-containing protein 112-like isoform X1 n=1 Tax=Octopus sinensis TaxID=2607531 RepID=A0A6P7SYX7_9MOLL|nr:coiled-coil domain-containing protein 112-like isoform X1 [Octopus sinensis]
MTTIMATLTVDPALASKKMDLKKELQKLRAQFLTIQRERDVILYGKRVSNRKDFLPLQEVDKKSNEEIKTEKHVLKQNHAKMQSMVSQFRKELKMISPSPEYVEKLKNVMEETEQSLSEFKENQRKSCEELMKEEKLTSLEIQALEKKFESWSKSGEVQINGEFGSKNHSKTSGPARDIMVDLPPEVASFDKYVLQNGGHQGGWDDYDHETFLRYRLKYKKKKTFLEQVLPALPGRCTEDVEQHTVWYEQYLQLNQEKKDAISRWKELKLKERQSSKEIFPDEEDKSKKLALQKKLEEERQQKLIQLQQWKSQQAAEKAKEENSKMKEKLAEERKKEKERKKKLELRKYVQEYREAKSKELMEVKRQEERQEMIEAEARRRFASLEVIRFREMDRLKTAKKIEKAKQKEEMAERKEKRLESLRKQVEVEVQRDPSRLLQPTAGWKERLKDNTSSNVTVPLQQIPHRAIPSWRAGLY